ncbi:hypothetical protein SEA_BANTAM_56 [Gordonia phage Bantam]|uniref:Uncharacterized protein n=1 Tax=Gordonia phage Bantam TaxID=1887641 RepID=A0A1B3AYC0_9CAUD|nr:hypothetical protein BIZ77_gp122 [Gordonia phage Bantam]AOE43746.1 hypothetical protein SEA_BANTAM_56 [Gordonia phage Bantam]
MSARSIEVASTTAGVIVAIIGALNAAAWVGGHESMYLFIAVFDMVAANILFAVGHCLSEKSTGDVQ